MRIDAVADPNYAYWHGATFSNDGTKVVFTDEWGGGTAARCRATDQLNWGANAIFDIVDKKLVFRELLQDARGADAPGELRRHICRRSSRFPAATSWSRPGTRAVRRSSTSPIGAPEEIGYFDRGPIGATALVLGGLWSTY